MDQYSAIKRGSLLIHKTPWIDLKIYRVEESGQKKKILYESIYFKF